MKDVVIGEHVISGHLINHDPLAAVQLVYSELGLDAAEKVHNEWVKATRPSLGLWSRECESRCCELWLGNMRAGCKTQSNGKAVG